MATNILKIFNKTTNSWESVSGVGLGADPSSPTGTVDLTNYYKKNETYSKSEIDTKVSSAGNFDASQYYNKSEVDFKITSAENFIGTVYSPKSETYSKSEVYSKSETDAKIPDISLLAKKSETYNKSDIDDKVKALETKEEAKKSLQSYLNKDFSLYKVKLPQSFISSLNFQYASPSAEYTTEIPQIFEGINLKEREFIFLDSDIFPFRNSSHAVLILETIHFLLHLKITITI